MKWHHLLVKAGLHFQNNLIIQFFELIFLGFNFLRDNIFWMSVQGEEIGMTGNYDITWEETVDPAGLNCGQEGYLVKLIN
jgi:hypothetical protein